MITKYINHLGEIVVFGMKPYYITENELRNFDYETIQNGMHISGFNRDKCVKERKIKIIVQKSSNELKNSINRIYNLFSKDIIDNKCGCFVIGNWKLDCFVRAGEKGSIENPNQIELSFTVVTDKPLWYKIQTFNYVSGQHTQGAYIYNSWVEPCKAIITFNGECINPSLTLSKSNGDVINKYGVNRSVSSNQKIVIDTRNQTIIYNNGLEINDFQNRDKTYDTFARIPTGRTSITWNGSYPISISLICERGEPEWI